jgi:hypothetical protein
MKARVSQLNKTEQEWKAFSKWVPLAGEIVVYNPDEAYKYARIKIGDGKRTLQDLEFTVLAAAEDLLVARQFSEIIDGGRISS